MKLPRPSPKGMKHALTCSTLKRACPASINSTKLIFSGIYFGWIVSTCRVPSYPLRLMEISGLRIIATTQKHPQVLPS